MSAFRKTVSRRDFLSCIATASAVALASRRLAFAGSLRGPEPIHMLVVGDSFIWGQGLRENEKFYTHTAEWLRHEAFGEKREVSVKVKAHSGSTIKLHENEAAALRKAGRAEDDAYGAEINVGFPSIWHQISAARDEYATASNVNGADIILLAGGITDISVPKLLDPFGDPELLEPLIEKYCSEDMFDLLVHAGSANPSALIVVVGYFPILSPKTDGAKLFNAWLETMAFPRALKPLANNPLTRSLFFRGVRKRTIERSRIWFEASNRHLRAAVDRCNLQSGQRRAVFVGSPITEDTCVETPETLLFRMGKMGRSEDPLFRERLEDCRSVLPQLKRSTGLDYPVRHCEVAAIGHPNAAGSLAYAAAIKSVLAPELAVRTI